MAKEMGFTTLVPDELDDNLKFTESEGFDLVIVTAPIMHPRESSRLCT